MSDTSQGEGWWQASDGKWYPPELHPDVRQPTGPTSPTTTPVPPASWAPPTQAFPPPGGPPGVPPPGPTGGPSNKKWIIPVVVGAAVVVIASVAVIAFLLLRSDDKSAEFVDPEGVEDRLLSASDIGTDFTDERFTPSEETTDPCGNQNVREIVPPTEHVGSAASDDSQGLYFEEEVIFHETAADNRKAFDLAVNSLETCNEGTLDDGTEFTISPPEDVSSEVGVTEAVEFKLVAGDTTVIVVGVRLDNCVASFTFVYPTSGGESAEPDELGYVEDGIDQLLR